MRTPQVWIVALALAASACRSTPNSSDSTERLAQQMAAIEDELAAIDQRFEELAASLEDRIERLQFENRRLEQILEHRDLPRDKPPTGNGHGGDDGLRIVPVFYGTDRAATGQSDPESFYGFDRRSAALSDIDYGVCHVSIPPNHKKGDHERPKWWKLEFSENPKKHIVITSVSQMTKDPFFSALKDELGRSQRREAFVFIHGFNTSFPDAVRTTGQLAFDLALDGAPILYSWPSHGGVDDYVADNGEIKWAMPHFRQFLSDVAERADASTIHLIAHSLGNTALCDAVQALSSADPSKKILSDIVLAAPDVDVDVFVRDYAPMLTSKASRVTLYASEKDLALKASEKRWEHPRLGQRVNVIPGIETIDASDVESDLFKHGYIIESSEVLQDIGKMLRENIAASARPALVAVNQQGKKWWRLEPED